MSKTEGIKAVIVGSSTLYGNALREALPKSGITTRDVSLLDEDDLDGTLTDYDGGAELITKITEEAIDGSQLVFLCSSTESSLKCLDIISKKRDQQPFVIDLSGATAEDDSVPKMTVSLPRKRKTASTIALPDSLAIGLAGTLEVCLRAGPLELAAANCLIPVSELGNEGNLSLHQQTVELLNFQQVPKDLFGRQLIFNIHPAISEIGRDGRSKFEKTVVSQVQELLEIADLHLSISAARAPIFYSTAISLFLKFKKSLTEHALRNFFEKDHLFQTEELSSDPLKIPTPIDSLESDLFQVGRIIPFPDLPTAYQIWVSYDNILRGGVLDAVELAEMLLQEAGLIRTH